MNRRYLLIDAGGTQLKLGLLAGNKLVQFVQAPANSGEGIHPALDLIYAIGQGWLAGTRPNGIGLAIPGIIDHERGRMRAVNAKFADAVGFDFNTWALDHFHCPIVLENDARAATIGEWQYGAGKGQHDMVMLTFGTGVGSSAIVGGLPMRGVHGQAGILMGHFTIDQHKGVCNCGNTGCVESVASAWALPAILQKQKGYKESAISKEGTLDFEALFRCAAAGDKVSVTVRDNFIRAWSLATVNAIHAYDPELVLLGGGVMQAGTLIRDRIQAHVDKHAWTPWGKVHVDMAALGNEAAIWGMKHLLDEALALDRRERSTSVKPIKGHGVY